MLHRAREDKPLLVYCHMGKVGGKRLNFYLKCHFGVRHQFLIESYQMGRAYTCEELLLDMRWNPFLRSIGGHMLRPFVDFRAVPRPLHWYTILRDPVERTICHYMQQIRRGRCPAYPIHEWLDRFPRREYWQVDMLAGEKNLDRAKEILLEKFVAVGLTEQYEESLFLLGWKLGLKGFRFNDGRGAPRPNYLGGEEIATSEADRIAQARESEGELRDRLSLDMELYEFGKTEFFDKHVDEYGRARLREDVEEHLVSCKRLTKANPRYLLGRAFDLGIYRPVIAVRRWRACRRESRDQRV